MESDHGGIHRTVLGPGLLGVSQHGPHGQHAQQMAGAAKDQRLIRRALAKLREVRRSAANSGRLSMRVLLPHWLGVPERCFYQDFQQGIASALRELGHETVQVPFAERGSVRPAESKKLYEALQAASFSAVLDLACWGYGLSRIALPTENGEGRPIFDAFGVPYIQWLFDQPCNQQMTGVLAAGRYAVYPDLGHPQQVRLLYPGLELTGEIFAPPAIRPENNRSAGKRPSPRGIDVLYLGNLIPEALERCWNDR